MSRTSNLVFGDEFDLLQRRATKLRAEYLMYNYFPNNKKYIFCYV